MRFILVILVIGLAAFGIACGSATSQSIEKGDTKSEKKNNPTPDPAPDRITLADAKKDFDAGAAIFIDTRNEAQYRSERIKGAINITTETLEAKYKEIPADKKIIVYCS